MRKKFDQDFILEELNKVGEKLDHPLEVYLIGGGAMAFQGMKEVTKDIDIVVKSGKDFKNLQKILKRMNYSEVEEMEEEYERLGAQRILENEEGCRFDIFNQKVANKLILSQNMQKRSENLNLKSNLQVMLTSPEDIFLFKCVAGRTTDIEDMKTLVQTSLNFETIEKEIKYQVDLIEEELFITHVEDALTKLEERYEITTPLPELLKSRIIGVYDQLEILTEINDEIRIEELKEVLEIPDTRIEKALNKLKEKGGIEIKGNRIEKTESPQV